MATPVAVQMNLHPIMNWDSSDVVEEFKKFKQKAQLAFKSFLKGTTDDEKVSYILLWSGNKGIDLYNSWDMSESDCNDPDTLLDKFERHLEPRSNHRIQRYEFQGLKQAPQETIDNFLSRLKNVAEKCKFKDREERIVDQLIWRCAHKEVQKSLIVKCRKTREDPHLALMSLRTTPLRADMKTPAELLNGRKYKTTLPTKIQPPIDQKETRAKLAATQEQAQGHHNKHAQYLPEMLGGQHVHTQDPITKTWIPAKVVNRAETPRSNMIETESGRQLKQQGPHPPNTRAAEENVYNTPQTPVRSRRSTRWRKNILPPVRYR
ncbi:Hypothetical predicted protein [Octopus vulgaris]|uniref:Retrotransposon gag domain-containing protein n=1 Tax=Octopus vulgaris TaxID=6645 RepID=A0AA36BHE0_OCTVU|nr:Hypothetical predicted protein [Octopus vulgaris]